MKENPTPPIPANAPREQILALTRKAYMVGLQEVIKGNTDPELKRQLAATRQHLNKGK